MCVMQCMVDIRKGSTKNARPDIKRPDNATPYQTEVGNVDNCLRIEEPTPSYVGVDVLKSHH